MLASAERKHVDRFIQFTRDVILHLGVRPSSLVEWAVHRLKAKTKADDMNHCVGFAQYCAAVSPQLFGSPFRKLGWFRAKTALLLNLNLNRVAEGCELAERRR